MVPPSKKTEPQEYSDEEARERFEQALKGALKTPHKPHKEKSKPKANQSTSEDAPEPARKIKGV
ncbi:MAG: hypothetical protein Q8M31_13780 [Beijerinckiaceae bacterium]|nr:hypothetical protein [Beijerinckiaceae bacterium]